MDPTAPERAWREYVRRLGFVGDPAGAPSILESSRATFFAGYAAGAGEALEAIKKLAERRERNANPEGM